MLLTPHKTAGSRQNGIFFPKLECWNPLTHVATVAAEVDKQRVLCRVSLDVLHDKFGATDEEPLRFIARHRVAIQEAARTLIEKGAYEADGSVEINASDF